MDYQNTSLQNTSKRLILLNNFSWQVLISSKNLRQLILKTDVKPRHLKLSTVKQNRTDI